MNHNDKTYIIERDSCTIYSYELGRDKRKKHCSCRYVNTRLVIISSQLTAVGGEVEGSGRSNDLLSWKGNKWVNEFPPMQRARTDHTIVSNDVYVIALGGDGDDTGVEVFSISSSMWSTVTSLPKRLPYITATLCEHDIIAMDRDGHTYTASIQSLLSSVKSASNYIHWKQICNPPLGEGECGPTLTTFHGYAVAVHNGIYQLVGGKWVKIGDMHQPRWDCNVLPHSEHMRIHMHNTHAQTPHQAFPCVKCKCNIMSCTILLSWFVALCRERGQDLKTTIIAK